MPLSSRSFIKFSPAADRRRLAALMFTDIAGYSALFHRDETLAMRLLGEKSQILREIFPSYGGREVKTLGDGFLVEFASVQEAVKCAYDIQSHLFQRNLGETANARFEVRIGIHLCDFIATDGDVFGNDVNISSRLEKIASPGGICVSQQVVDQVRDKLELIFTPLKAQKLKNIKRAVVCYEVELPWFEHTTQDHVLSRFQKYFSSDMSLRHFLWGSSRLIVIPFIAWASAVYLLPNQNVTSAQMISTGETWFQSFLGLNPILAMTSLVAWIFHLQDRRLLYMFLTFVLASMNLVPMFPEFFGVLDPLSQQALSILASGFIPLVLVALTGAEIKKKALESVATIGISMLFLWALLRTSSESLTYLHNKVVLIALISTAYLVFQAWVQTKQRSVLSALHIRRAIYSVLAVVSFANERTRLIFPIIYPVVVVLYTVKSHLESTRSLAKIARASQTIDQIGAAVLSGEAYEEKLSIIQARLCELLEAERSTLYLTDIDSADLQLKAQAIYGPTETLKKVALKVSPTEGLIGRVWKSRSPLMVNDMKSETRDEYRTTSCLLCPVVQGNEIVGVITFSDKRGSESFDEKDLKIVQHVAKDIALLSVNHRFQGMIDHFVSEKLNDFKITS